MTVGYVEGRNEVVRKAGGAHPEYIDTCTQEILCGFPQVWEGDIVTLDQGGRTRLTGVHTARLRLDSGAAPLCIWDSVWLNGQG